MPYLFTHFKEKITPDGEQVYFAVSRDGLSWEQVNGGEPVLTSTMGTKGCRDIEIVRLHTGGFVILTTDLGITYHFDENYNVDENYILSQRAMKIAKEHGTSVAAISIAYMANQELNVIPIMFFDDANQIKEAFCGADIKLTKEEMESLII